MQALDDNDTWKNWYNYPLGRKPLDVVGFLQLKFDGSIACLKARLVAKGYV